MCDVLIMFHSSMLFMLPGVLFFAAATFFHCACVLLPFLLRVASCSV